MTDYFKEEFFNKAKKQRKTVLGWYISVAVIYFIFSLGMFLWYKTFVYQDTRVTLAKAIQYGVTALFVMFSFVYLGIPYKRVNRYYKLCYNLLTGIRETSIGSFLEYDENLHDKDGVDMKALIFIEWNKYKKDFFERKVWVFDEVEYPELIQGANMRYVTQGNVLISYEILDVPTEEGADSIADSE